MVENGNDPELQAIQSIISALEPLKEEARERAVDYVLKRLGLSRAPSSAPAAESAQQNLSPTQSVPFSQQHGAADIRTLKEEKAPRNAIDMTVLVGYYLTELAPQHEKKEAIGTGDVEKYFKQASFPLPSVPRQTLFAAKNAGYFDAVERGKYKLNPVGHNLAVHGLPASEERGNNRRPGVHATRKGHSVARRKRD